MKPLFVAMCAALLIFAIGARKSLAEMQVQRVTLLAQADTLLVLGVEKEVLLEGLSSRSRREWQSLPVIKGTDVVSDSQFALELKDVDIVYSLDEACAACLLNLALLDSLRERGVRVVAIAVRGSALSLKEYAMRNGITFPLFLKPSGHLVEVVENPTTPLTVIVRGRRITSVHAGRLNREVLERELRLSN